MAKEKSSPSKILVTLAAFVIVVAGMRAAETIIVPFLLSVFIAITSAPLLFWLQRKGFPTPLALLVVIISVVGVIIGIVALIGTSVDDFTRALPLYKMRLEEISSGFLAWLAGIGIVIPAEQLGETFDPGKLMDLVAGGLSKLGKVLKNTFLILLVVSFILLEGSTFPNKLAAAFGPGAHFDHFDKFRADVNRYLGIKTLTSLATGLIISTWLAILGVDFALLWGLLAFLLNFVPTIGSIIASVPPIILALVQLGPGPAILTLIGFVVVNLMIGSIIEPKFMGRSLGLSTLVVFLSLVFWGWVLGPVGMLLSVLLTMTLKIAMDSYEETRWMAIMLGPELSKKAVSRMEKTAGTDEAADNTNG
ncbi:MAG TPA: AI-2E family transporter [Nitrospiria bacterium]|nr:AI-2E family transporter [Nitrospiria bacterium]